jgi:hypothetical protein
MRFSCTNLFSALVRDEDGTQLAVELKEHFTFSLPRHVSGDRERLERQRLSTLNTSLEQTRYSLR